ncbi:MAG: hypothetical protein MUE52_11110 [Tabrizicola sp.]|jgi:hypothetical protein|nr:hypothetical protein [Tabrizicola sp.]
MPVTLWTGMTALGLSLASPAPAQEIDGSVFNVSPYWEGSASNGDDGQFLYCSVSIIHGQGQQLWFLLRRDDRFFIMVATPAATFTPGEEFEVSLSANNGQPFATWASAADPKTIVMSFPGIDQSIAALRNAELLSIVVNPKLSLALGTPDLGAALDATRACLSEYSAPG